MDPKEPKPSRRSLIGQTIADKYRVLALLGTGGMGSVFEAEHVAIRRLVAIKVLNAAQAQNQTALKRFHQEAWAAGAIGHPNLCAVFDVGALSDGSPYLVMERLFGETLNGRLRRERALPIPEVIDIVRQVLAGLGTAHERGVLHRDIKPENVFLAEQPGFPTMAKLLDFGVSKIVSSTPGDEWDEKSALTKTGIVMGTPYYLSPEQARAFRDLDARADLYGCGVLLYELLTGERPFVANHYNALLLRILQGNPTPPSRLRPDISAELEAIVLKAMAKERDDRYATAAELSRALGSVRDRAATSAGMGASPGEAAPLAPLTVSVEIPIFVTDALPAHDDDDDTAPDTEIIPRPRPR
jgi:serine/threonine protein kinase